MRKKLIKPAVLLLAMVFVFACSDKYMGDYDYLNLGTKVSITLNDETFVSSELATDVANTFLSKENAKNGIAKSLSSATVETIMDRNNLSMYVVNYPEGGWVIVGATKNYYPVLAYSDEGNFEMRPNDEMGGVIVWLEETQEAVRVSASFADSTKAQMRRLWQAYEKNDFKVIENSGAKNQQDMEDRIRALNRSNLRSEGWFFSSLDDAQYDLDYYTYQEILNMANYFNGSSQFTIVGLKSNTTGPLMTTQWHQGSPFNAHVDTHMSNHTGSNGWLAGCGPVAMAQIMKYHGKPASNFIPQKNKFPHQGHWDLFDNIGWSIVFDWSQMTNTGGSSTPYLIHAAGRAANALYQSPTVSGGTKPVDIKYAFDNIFEYTTTNIADHNIDHVILNISYIEQLFLF